MESNQKPSASGVGASYDRESEMEAYEPANPRIQPNQNGPDEHGAQTRSKLCGKIQAISLADGWCAPSSTEVAITSIWRGVAEAKRTIGLISGMIALTLLWGTIAQAYTSPFLVIDGKDLQSLARLADDSELDQMAVRDLRRNADSNHQNSRANPYLLFKRMESWFAEKFSRERSILRAGRETPQQDVSNFRYYTGDAEPDPKWTLNEIPRPYPSQGSAYGALGIREPMSSHLSLLDDDLLSRLENLRPHHEPGMPDTRFFSEAESSPCPFAGGGFALQNSPGAGISGNRLIGTSAAADRVCGQERDIARIPIVGSAMTVLPLQLDSRHRIHDLPRVAEVAPLEIRDR